jgi:hypothetical protein
VKDKTPQYATIDEYTNCEIVPIDATGVGVEQLEDVIKRAEETVSEYLAKKADRYLTAPFFTPSTKPLPPDFWSTKDPAAFHAHVKEATGTDLSPYEFELPPDLPLVERPAPRIPDLCPDDTYSGKDEP